MNYARIVGMSCALIASVAATSSFAETKVTLRSELTQQPLNPARGEASPQANVLWGDITKDVPSGIILEFADGFSSPPHIHNITYRAIVIEGAIHNDDPGAAVMSMGPGSFWVQPAGEDHVTSTVAAGGAVAFLEILEGPYLVQPSDEAFENSERPLNLVFDNIVWLPAEDMRWLGVPGAASSDGAEMALLWGDLEVGKLSGTLLKVPAGTQGTLTGQDTLLRSVVIQGAVGLDVLGKGQTVELEPGSFFSASAGDANMLTCTADTECTVYLRTKGTYSFVAK
ncbi:DUF4437 domain-containing protein [Pseudophaeobacter sp.]|uniref:DUF4437 domain-containing protein n=1 Tax=Pseudophaeobacter sp. TaxID=1971739 RepID=UPI00329879AC